MGNFRKKCKKVPAEEISKIALQKNIPNENQRGYNEPITSYGLSRSNSFLRNISAKNSKLNKKTLQLLRSKDVDIDEVEDNFADE
ncbi:hypothetical protein AVEN_222358-1 [Araneus ventricosus]|uniref:Uncharacterized protein n=1 Tax=Araneus ventricosus TaxID=182803 RepID=A0A4Y2NQ42_ARAVE|nr:hypothetical protein AVEN_255116-1 [Araneus ventricosus]GBN40815.1 hypothetical protein AVEN_222358-1 [Araneus ventricosus]